MCGEHKPLTPQTPKHLSAPSHPPQQTPEHFSVVSTKGHSAPHTGTQEHTITYPPVAVSNPEATFHATTLPYAPAPTTTAQDTTRGFPVTAALLRPSAIQQRGCAPLRLFSQFS
jgi:hypothetical protein